ncbi:MAG: FG-GAP repeat domain-containing protein [Oligoflexia bacterium]
MKKIYWSLVCGLSTLVCVGQALGQTLHPFAQPKLINTLTTNSAAGALDVNRDSSPDVLVPGFFMGSMVNSLDEEGGGIAVNFGGPATLSQNGQIGIPLSFASGRIDQDEFEDLVTVSSTGAVVYHRNLGSTRLAASNFAPAVVVDNFAQGFPINPPFVAYSFPYSEIADFDGDGNQDILVAGSPVDTWSGNTLPGFVGFYKGDGLGGFQPFRFGISGNAIDGKFADLDGNGTRDTLVALVETGAVGAYTYDFVHVRFNGGSLQQVTPPQSIVPGKVTSFDLADMTGDGTPDYLISYAYFTGSRYTSGVLYYAGSGQGQVINSNWGQMTLPANPTSFGEFISSVLVGDFNRDSHSDVVLLRHYLQPGPGGSGMAVQYADSELLVAMGPNLAFATFESISLGGFQRIFYTHDGNLFTQAPYRSEARGVKKIELGGDQGSDLLVAGLYVVGTSAASTYIATLKNLTPARPGDVVFEKVGDPSGGAPGFPARMGFDGGRPVPGNSSFGATVSNLRGGSLVGLVWGPLGLPKIFSSFGVDANLVPVEWFSAGLAAGSGLGGGFFRHALPIPNNPALVGAAGYFQFNYYDFVSGTFGGTQATGLWIGQ